MVCAAINAARENVAILLTAGRSPITETGLPGSRDGYIHWAQEMYDQAGMFDWPISACANVLPTAA